MISNILFVFCLVQLICLLILGNIVVRRSTRRFDEANSEAVGGKKRALVMYAYSEKNEIYQNTLRYFLEMGVQESDHIDYLFIIQGFNTSSVQFPTHYKNVQVLNGSNDCFDFGAYGVGFQFMGGLKEVGDKYEFFMFINPSALGPILPKYWPKSVHWTEILFEMLIGSVHAAGGTISCAETGPYLDGWWIAATHQAILAANKTGTFGCQVHQGEIAFSQAVIAAGLNLDSLMLKYPSGFDWTNTSHHSCNRRPIWRYTNDKGDFKLDMHPLETVFYKPVWYDENNALLSNIYYNECLTYMEWARKRQSFKSPK